MKLIHLTDPHFVPHGRKLYGLDPAARLRAAIEDIQRRQRDARFVLITGDLAHEGDVAAYVALRAVLATLELPYYLLLGNHDARAAFCGVFPEAALDAHGFVQQVLETEAGPFLLLDTHQPGTHQGWYCETRLAWLDAQLAALGGRRAFLAMHHPPLAVGLPAMDAFGLVQQPAFAEVLARHGNVRHIFFGHIHRPVHGAFGGITFSTQRALNHQVAPCFVETPGRILGSHEPPAYSIVSIDPDQLLIHEVEFLDASPRFDLFDPQAAGAQDPAALAGRMLER